MFAIIGFFEILYLFFTIEISSNSLDLCLKEYLLYFFRASAKLHTKLIEEKEGNMECMRVKGMEGEGE